MNYLVDFLDNSLKFKEISKNIDEKRKIYLSGVSNAAVKHLLYSFYVKKDIGIFAVFPSEKRAYEIYKELLNFKVPVFLLSEREINFHNVELIETDKNLNRMTSVIKLASKQKAVILTSGTATCYPLENCDSFNKKTLQFKTGEEVNPTEAVEKLINIGYRRVSRVEARCEFALRGGILDIFPIDSNPVRIEFFGEEIDSMREFDIQTQRSLKKVEDIRIFQAYEFIPSEKDFADVSKKIDDKLKYYDEHFFYELDKERQREKYRYFKESLNLNEISKNADLILPLMKKGKTSSIFDYIPDDYLIYLEDLNRIFDENQSKLKEFKAEKEELFKKGEIFEEHINFFLNFSKIIETTENNAKLNVSGLATKRNMLENQSIVQWEIFDGETFNKNYKLLNEHIESIIYKGYKVIFLVSSKERGLELKGLLEDFGRVVRFSDNFEENLQTGEILICVLDSFGGFTYPKEKVSFITDKEILGFSKNFIRKKKSKGKEVSLTCSDLSVGDFIVHENHGIGKYEGITKVEVEGIICDYVVLLFKGGDKIYVPVDQMRLIQKYIGKEGTDPKLNSLNSPVDWLKTKERAKKEIDAIAADLVKLYSKRSKLKGYAFSPDGPWQKDFENSFIYEDTDSQIKATAEIKEDMEKEIPMDRLLLGDVGYGKTEVAIRAAFKAVTDSKQVAFLVPTTILAQQHFNTIKERLKDYPVNVEMISRFRTAGQQKKILEDVKKGIVDILIGTHRILSEDIKFKDLGLLVIDEEQRFGVKAKEKLKMIKENVDVLTLSATPIPRTLQMGLTGIRDISTLEEPPEERVPVAVYVSEYNEHMIKEAIESEIKRGGQVYLVYNRINGIEDVKSKIENLVPTARVAVGHGRMTEKALEKIMTDFINGEYDVLICTTIIETGLDIRNVNTMIIYDADKMGLSQMYQLKGRVGRMDRKSYAYLTYENGKVLSELAQKRLLAIKNFTEFGSGFKIAMKDLELRGAGNILGEVQHGHMSSIGYDLYVKMLHDSISELKGNVSVKREVECEINLKVSAYIPKKYIDDEDEKVIAYKEISSIENEKDVEKLIDDFLDRFGDIPKETENLINIAFIKSKAKNIGFKSIIQKNDKVEFSFIREALFTLEDISKIKERYKDAEFMMKIPYGIKIKVDKTNIIKEVETFLRFINELKEKV